MIRFQSQLSIILFSLLFIVLIISIACTNQYNPLGVLSKGNTDFAVSLYREMSLPDGNVLFSPYGISTAMAMVYEGARENTAEEIKDALNFKLVRKELHSAFGELNQTLMTGATQKGYTLNIANGLCLTNKDVGVNEAFQFFLKSAYDAELFRGDLKIINAWVKRKTEGRIEKILEHLSPQSACVILNSIYFKGSWKKPFRKSETYDGIFTLSSTKTIQTPLMVQSQDFRYLEEKTFRAISIPYKGDNLSMVILLPNVVEGVKTLEKRLTGKRLRNWLTKLDKSKVRGIELHLPKYTIKTNWDLIPPFKKLGVKEAFIPYKADFSGMGIGSMGSKEEVCIGQIKHNAFMNVNEAGTEAAGATGVEIRFLSGSINELIFRANHPFLFIIRDNPSGSILFMGRVADPSLGTDG